jgi:hypothetical protein
VPMISQTYLDCAHNIGVTMVVVLAATAAP